MKGYIVKGIGGFYYVKTEEGIVECKPRGIFRKQKIAPVAGDEVTVETENGASVIAEIVRGGLNGVSKGQFEAGYAQGFNTAEVLLYIVLPQAYRNIVPTLLSQVITTIKDSSYLANVATIELMARIRQLLSAAGTYNGLGTVNVSDVMVLFGTACVIYFIINFTLSCIVRSMQNKRKKALVFAPAKAA